MTPSLGRIVHLTAKGNVRAAIISAVHSDTSVELFVFGTFDDSTWGRPTKALEIPSEFDSNYPPAEGCWNWPPRVGP